MKNLQHYRQKSRFRLSPFRCALRGLYFGFMSQPHMKVHVVMAILVVGAGVYFSLTLLEWAIIIGCIFLVLMAELMNTAVEIVVDLVSKKRSVRAMLAKDVAAGAVLMASLGAALIGSLIFLNKVHNIGIGG